MTTNPSPDLSKAIQLVERRLNDWRSHDVGCVNNSECYCELEQTEAAWEQIKAHISALQEENSRLKVRPAPNPTFGPVSGCDHKTTSCVVCLSFHDALQTGEQQRDALQEELDRVKRVLRELYTFPRVRGLLAPSGSLGSIADQVESVLGIKASEKPDENA